MLIPMAVAAISMVGTPDLSWMEGVWVTPAWGGEMEEHWTSSKGNSLLGLNRTVIDGKTSHKEFIEIALGEETTLTVWITSANPPRSATYKLTKFEPQKAVFTNPEHARLHTMTYWRDPSGLHCELQGVRQEKPYSERFDFQLRPTKR